jgi:hypothetical protein
MTLLLPGQTVGQHFFLAIAGRMKAKSMNG